tara:strand:- start:265 stop:1272 length:1008 start_codon:yes stop_codon:yes gene_type:complete
VIEDLFKEKKVRNLSDVASKTKMLLGASSREAVVAISGINGGQMVEPLPKHARSACEHVIQGQNNTFIVMGRDRPAARVSGYGGKGHTGCGTIDIIAGKGSHSIVSQTTNGTQTTNIEMNPNMFLDASRIYISQKTDVDRNFGLARGSTGKQKAKAAIAIKSDAVRIIAREGIKLITMQPGGRNSVGTKLISTTGIDLIAGNNDKYLEPLVKGDSLVRALGSMVERIDEINSIVDAFLTYQLEYNTVIMNHTHPDIVNIAISAFATQFDSIKELTDGSTYESPTVSDAGLKNITALNTISKKDLISNKLNLGAFKFQFLEQFSKDYINSRHNNTN